LGRRQSAEQQKGRERTHLIVGYSEELHTQPRVLKISR